VEQPGGVHSSPGAAGSPPRERRGAPEPGARRGAGTAGAPDPTPAASDPEAKPALSERGEGRADRTAPAKPSTRQPRAPAGAAAERRRARGAREPARQDTRRPNRACGGDAGKRPSAPARAQRPPKSEAALKKVKTGRSPKRKPGRLRRPQPGAQEPAAKATDEARGHKQVGRETGPTRAAMPATGGERGTTLL